MLWGEGKSCHSERSEEPLYFVFAFGCCLFLGSLHLLENCFNLIFAGWVIERSETADAFLIVIPKSLPIALALFVIRCPERSRTGEEPASQRRHFYKPLIPFRLRHPKKNFLRFLPKNRMSSPKTT
jgi:hypothetical protein